MDQVSPKFLWPLFPILWSKPSKPGTDQETQASWWSLDPLNVIFHA